MEEKWGSPVTDKQAAGKADQVFYVGPAGRPATSEKAALEGLKASKEITPNDIITLGNQLVDGSGLYSPLRPITQSSLENSLKVLKGMTRLGETAKQTESIQLLRQILDAISKSGQARADVMPKLDQVLEHLKVRRVVSSTVG